MSRAGSASRAEPMISDPQAERARVLARSLAQRANQRAKPRASGGVGSLGSLAARSAGSPFCSIHFSPNSLKTLQLYDTKLVTYKFQNFNQSNMNHEKCC